MGIGAGALPTVGVVIPTRNRAPSVVEAVRAVLVDPATSEVVVAIDGDDRRSERALERLAAAEPRLRVARTDGEGAGAFERGQAARDAAVALCSTEIVLALDDDVVARPGLVSGHAAHHRDADGLVVLGYMPVAIPPGRERGAVRLYREGYEAACLRYEADASTVLTDLWGGNFSVRRRHWLAANARGVVRAGYHGDKALGLALREQGLRGVFDRRLVAEHRYHRCATDVEPSARSSALGLRRLHEAFPALVAPPTGSVRRRRAVEVIVRLSRPEPLWRATRSALVALAEASARAGVARLDYRAVRLLWRLSFERARREAATPPPAPAGAQPPKTVSVVIATRRRPELLSRCLGAVAALDPPPDEVIVVDNSDGDEGTAAAAAAHGAECLVVAEVGLSRARNAGARRARGDVIAFLDDDAVPAPSWLEALLTPFADGAVMAVTGRIVPLEVRTPAQRRSVDAGWIGFGESRRSLDRGDRHWFERATFGGIGIGANMAFRACAFDAWPGFRESLGRGAAIPGCEENHAFFELLKRGHRVVFTPDAVVAHPHPATERELMQTQERALSEAFAYATLLLVEEPGYRLRTVRYLLGRVLGRPQPWAGPHSPGESAPLLTTRQKLAAARRGPSLYLRSRRASVVGGGRLGGAPARER